MEVTACQTWRYIHSMLLRPKTFQGPDARKAMGPYLLERALNYGPLFSRGLVTRGP